MRTYPLTIVCGTASSNAHNSRLFPKRYTVFDKSESCVVMRCLHMQRVVQTEYKCLKNGVVGSVGFFLSEVVLKEE